MLDIYMGKNVSLYLDDEADELVGSITGRGTLINNLIKEHFSNDEDYLNRKKKALELELSAINAKLQAKAEEKFKLLEDLKKEKEVSKEETERKIALTEWERKWADEEISDDEYFSKFKDGKFIL